MYAQLIFKIKQMTSQYVAFIHIFSQTYNLALFTNQKRVDRIQQDIRCKWRNLLSFKLRNSKQTMPISAPKSCWKVWLNCILGLSTNRHTMNMKHPSIMTLGINFGFDS